jgi:hypothetical protein
MTTYQKTPFLSEIASGRTIPAAKLDYLKERAMYNIYGFIIAKFLEQEKQGFTRAKLARRIGRKPEVITRLLGCPGNWTIATISDLLVGIAAEEFLPASASLLSRSNKNFQEKDCLKSSAAVTSATAAQLIDSWTPSPSSLTSGGDVAERVIRYELVDG